MQPSGFDSAMNSSSVSTPVTFVSFSAWRRMAGLLGLCLATIAHGASSDRIPIDAETRALLTEVQQAAVRYFYDFAHPVSGFARVGSERPPELCAIGGTGWGFFNLIVA